MGLTCTIYLNHAMPPLTIRVSLRKPDGFSLSFCIELSTWLGELSQVQKDVLEIAQSPLCSSREKSRPSLTFVSTLVSELGLT